MMRWVNMSLSSRLFIVFSVSSVSLCPLCLNKPVDYVLVRHRRALLDVVFDTEDAETQRTQRNFVISHQRLYRPRTVEFACLAITAGAPRSARGLFVYTLSVVIVFIFREAPSHLFHGRQAGA